MKLTVLERVIILGLLPQEANFLMLKLIRSVKEDLSFSDNEHKKLKFQVTKEGMTVWDKEADTKVLKKVEIGEIVTAEIVKALVKMNKEDKLKEEHITLYEKFIENSDDKPKEKKPLKAVKNKKNKK